MVQVAAERMSSASFSLHRDDLTDLQNRDAHYRSIGGLAGITSGLGVDVSVGLKQTDVESGDRIAEFGRNEVPKTPPEPLWKLFFEALQDFTLIVLMVAAVLSIILDTTLGSAEHKKTGWVSGTAILIAVFLVSSVTALNDWSKEKQFRKLESTNRALVSVLRDGKLKDIDVVDLVVGDVVGIRTGDLIPADGVFISGSSFSCDESAMTGESDAVKKNHDKPFFLSGTKAVEGECRMLVTSVGVHTEIGRTKKAIDDESGDQQTPLELKLEIMTKQIGKVGVFVAVATVIVAVIQWIVRNARLDKPERFTRDENLKLVQFFILGVTILVVAIPEGLPLAVTISLAYSMQRMTKDKCLVRKLAACETCGGVTNICSDKTGTLTENKMTACEIWSGNQFFHEIPSPTELNNSLMRRIGESISVNSTAFLTKDHSTGQMIFSGNKTEMALLNMCTGLGLGWEKLRSELKTAGTISYPFSSAKKSMATVVPCNSLESGNESGMRLHVKGAPDILLNYCTHYLDAAGQKRPLTGDIKERVHVAIDAMANTGLRTLLIADRDFPHKSPADFGTGGAQTPLPVTPSSTGTFGASEGPHMDNNGMLAATPSIAPGVYGSAPLKESPAPSNTQSEIPLNDICLVAVVGIKDPLRPGVKQAVAKCKIAGIFVRMVTGDNMGTAKSIARECGILTDGLVIEGPSFRAMSEAERLQIIPKLQVIARSSPTDKYLLVDTLIKLGEVVAVTGDGTNDAAALAKADVGLAMGIAGTQVAKDASDIIILDDNFASIVRAVMWGRSVYDSVRKFLQFQLTINLVALLLVFVATCAGYDTPLTAVQLLWVNLIMDTFAALALGTERPTEEILNRRPYGRYDTLINKVMLRTILTGCTLQLIILFVLLFRGAYLWDLPEGKDIANGDLEQDGCAKGTSQHYTIIFNVFVFLQLFNEIACHKLFDDKSNIFVLTFSNPISAIVLLGSAGFQAFIVEVGSSFTSTCGLTWSQWLISIAIGLIAIPWAELMRFIPVKDDTLNKDPDALEKAIIEAESSQHNGPSREEDMRALRKNNSSIQKTLDEDHSSSNNNNNNNQAGSKSSVGTLPPLVRNESQSRVAQ